MKKILFVALMAAIGLAGPAHAAKKKSVKKDDSGTMDNHRECSNCHNLSNEEATKLLKADKFGAKITGVRPSAVKGLWEVMLNQSGKTFLVYIDFSKKNLIEGVKVTPLDSIGQEQPLKKVDALKIPLDNAIVIGDPNAPKKIIVFDDPDCPYCRKLHPDMKQIAAKRKDVAFFIKMFPLPIHPQAYEKSKAIQCSKSLQMLDDAVEGKSLPAASCETDELEKNKELGASLDISGTPAIILPDGRLIPGYVPAQQLEDLIDHPAK